MATLTRARAWAFNLARSALARLTPVHSNLCRPVLACALSLTLLGASLTTVSAQNVLVLVNTHPVTAFDVEQRIRIAAMTENRKLDRKSALTELVDDQVKLTEARRVGYRIRDEGVEGEFLRLAKANRQTELEFSAALKRAGIEPAALKDKIRADLAWNVLLRDQGRKGSQVSNDEIASAVETRRREVGTITEYHLQPVVFIVPQGRNLADRERAANAARAQFTSCETGFDELRKLPDVAIRSNTIRSSAELAKPLAALLEKTPVGRLTPPSRTSQGVEMVAVCSKRTLENPSTTTAEVAESLSNKKLVEGAKTYIEELRKKNDIKYR